MADKQLVKGAMNGAIEQEARQMGSIVNGGRPASSDGTADTAPVPVPATVPAAAGPATRPTERVAIEAGGEFDPMAVSGSHNAMLAQGLENKVVNCLGLSPKMSAAERNERANAAMAAMRELAPRDPAEGLLVAQMVAAHSAGMDRLGRAANVDRPADATELHSRQAARLMGLFARQYDSLLRNRERTRRTVRVEHVRLTVDGTTRVRAEEERSQ